MPTAPAWLRALGCALACVLTVGCTTTLPTPSPVNRLRALPDYEDAMRSAPIFTTEALRTVADQHAERR